MSTLRKSISIPLVPLEEAKQRHLQQNGLQLGLKYDLNNEIILGNNHFRFQFPFSLNSGFGNEFCLVVDGFDFQREIEATEGD